MPDFWDNNEMDDLPSEEEAASIEAETGAEDATAVTPEESVVEEIYQEAPKASAPVNKALQKIQKVQDRLDMAHCYRLLLDQSMFDTATPAAQRVDSEIREFVCQRLEILMGVQPEARRADQVTEVFTGTEIKVLKALAKVAEKKFQETQQKPKEPEPVQTPTLKKVNLDEAPKPKVPAPPAPQPQRRQLPQPQLRRPGQQQQPQQQPQKQVAKPANARVMVDDARIPAEYKEDPTLKITPDGKVLVQGRDGEGKPIWEFNPATKRFDKPFYKNVALPARPDPNSAQPKQMLPIEQMMGVGSPLMQQHADGMIGFAERRATGLKIGNQFARTLVNSVSADSGSSDDEPERQ